MPRRLNAALDVGVETMRKKLSIATRDAVLKEFNHLCAVCGGIGPQVHHVDEDNSNNVVENLLPLCPNCHLRDQHNPTRRHAVEKLQLFRKYKDPFSLLTRQSNLLLNVHSEPTDG